MFTSELIQALAKRNNKMRIVEVKLNQGYDRGIINGLEAASGKYVGFMCGDGQINPGDILKVCYELVNDSLDLCKVRRVVRLDGSGRRFVTFLD